MQIEAYRNTEEDSVKSYVFNTQENNVTETLAVLGFSLGIVQFELSEND
jgi:hypothetical protein